MTSKIGKEKEKTVGEAGQFIVKGYFHDFDDFRSAVVKWDFDFRQLDRGTFEADMMQAGTGSVQFGHARFNRHLHQRANPPQGLLTFAILHDSAVPHIWRGKILPQNGIMVISPNKEMDSVSRPGFDTYTLSFSQQLLTQTSQSLGVPEAYDLSNSADFVEADPSLLDGLRRWLAGVSRQLDNLPEAKGIPLPVHLLEHEMPRRFLRVLATTKPFNETASSRMRDRAMKKVEEYINDTIHEPITLTDLCQAAQVSERTLRYAFLERFGVGPKAYLQALRLNRVRRDLRNADHEGTRIADIANRWGFWHMGQFAADYRELFDELPSETLKKGQR